MKKMIKKRLTIMAELLGGANQGHGGAHICKWLVPCFGNQRCGYFEYLVLNCMHIAKFFYWVPNEVKHASASILMSH